jgi:hypothetical protein
MKKPINSHRRAQLKRGKGRSWDWLADSSSTSYCRSEERREDLEFREHNLNVESSEAGLFSLLALDRLLCRYIGFYFPPRATFAG